MTLSMRTLSFTLALGLGLGPAGCGNEDDDDTAGDGDADADADADSDADADADADADGDGDGDGDGAAVFWLVSDFVSSVYGRAALADLETIEELGPAEGDAVAVKSGGRFAIVERTLGAVTLLAADLSIEWNFSVADEGGPSPNPHDMAIVSNTKAYVTRFAQGTLAIVDPSTGTLTGTIDLAAHDPDGVPDMDAVTIAGDRALVSLERLDAFQPRGESEVVAIDTAADEVVATVALPLANPSGRFRVHGTSGELLLACVATYGAADGGVVGLGPEEGAPHVIVTEESGWPSCPRHLARQRRCCTPSSMRSRS
jgi:hypothetical protein